MCTLTFAEGIQHPWPRARRPRARALISGTRLWLLALSVVGASVGAVATYALLAPGPIGGTFEITNVSLLVQYTNGSGSGVGWLGQAQNDVCTNCPVAIRSDQTVSLIVVIHNLDSNASHPVLGVETPTWQSLEITSTNASVPFTVPAGSNVSLALDVRFQGVVPPGSSDGVLVAMIFGPWAT